VFARGLENDDGNWGRLGAGADESGHTDAILRPLDGFDETVRLNHILLLS